MTTVRLGNCKDWCQHKAEGNGVYRCWKCGHFFRIRL